VIQRIPLTSGGFALVDDEDAPRVLASGPWHARTIGHMTYAEHSVSNVQKVSMHRLITGWEYVVHADDNGLNNQRVNLRQPTRAQKLQHRRVNSNSRSGLKGVKQVRSGRWQAIIIVDGLRVALGTHAIAEDAGRAYDRAARANFGEFARLNFPLGE